MQNAQRDCWHGVPWSRQYKPSRVRLPIPADHHRILGVPMYSTSAPLTYSSSMSKYSGGGSGLKIRALIDGAIVPSRTNNLYNFRRRCPYYKELPAMGARGRKSMAELMVPAALAEVMW